MMTLGSSAIVSVVAIRVVVLISISELSNKVILLLLELMQLLKEMVLLYVLVLNQMIYT